MSYLFFVFSSFFDDLFCDFVFGYVVWFLYGDGLLCQIKFDVNEDGENFVVYVELFGVVWDDIQVFIDGDVVLFSVEIKQYDQKSDDEWVLCSECYYGVVLCSIWLLVVVDEVCVVVKYDKGVLMLMLLKKQVFVGVCKLCID